jgi:hypothetical protein
MPLLQIHEYNDKQGKLVAAYTFDAGPNAVIYTQEEHLVEVTRLALQALPPAKPSLPLASLLVVLPSFTRRLAHRSGVGSWRGCS